MYKTEQFNRGYERPMQHTGIHSSLILKANYFCGSTLISFSTTSLGLHLSTTQVKGPIFCPKTQAMSYP